MFEKTIQFFETEYGLQFEQNNEFCLALWEEKSRLIHILLPQVMALSYTSEQVACDLSYLAKDILPAEDVQEVTENIGRMKNRQDYVRKTIEQMTNTPDGKKYLEEVFNHMGERLLSNESRNIEMLADLLSPNCETPVEFIPIIYRLIELNYIYKNLFPAMGCHSWPMDAKIDHLFLKLITSVYSVMFEQAVCNNKFDRVRPGANIKIENAEINKAAIEKVLKEFNVTDLNESFHNDEDLRNAFVARVKKVGQDFFRSKGRSDASLTSKDRIYRVAREILAEKKVGEGTASP